MPKKQAAQKIDNCLAPDAGLSTAESLVLQVITACTAGHPAHQGVMAEQPRYRYPSSPAMPLRCTSRSQSCGARLRLG